MPTVVNKYNMEKIFSVVGTHRISATTYLCLFYVGERNAELVKCQHGNRKLCAENILGIWGAAIFVT